jgi:hypothetical protein
MAKRKKVKLPKRIAGIKVPKSARKGPVADFLNSDFGQSLLADVLVVAGATANMNPDSRPGRLVRHPIDSLRAAGNSTRSVAHSARDNAEATASRLAHALSEGIRAFRAALDEPHAGAEPGIRHAEDVIDNGSAADILEGEGTEVGKKKSHASRTEGLRETP